MEIKNYINTNKDRFLEELFDLLRIPSVSSLSEHKNDMYKVAEYWKKLLLEAGADKADVYETKGNPITFGEKIVDASLPTVMVYGHMDVMPVDPINQWNTKPFEPTIIDGKIYARGADDDKGQSFIHAKAFEYLVKTNSLLCNVKFLLEGEEEIGSPNLEAWCKTHKKMLQSDVILVSDTSMINENTPTITTGLRGLCYWQIEVTGPNRDLHSGLFGGSVANPINMLAKMIASMVDDTGHITIPGFYDNVEVISEKERKLLAKAPFDEDAYKKSLDINTLFGEKGFSTNERTGIRPTLDVCGIWGGYTGEGAKTVLPSKAYAKVSSRLVPDQDYTKIAELFMKHIKTIAPAYVKVKVEHLHGGHGYVCPISFPAYIAAEKAFEETYGKSPIPVRSGGSIPIISTFEKVLGTKSLLVGFGLDEDAIHSPNESFSLKQLYRGIETISTFYKYYAKVKA